MKYYSGNGYEQVSQLFPLDVKYLSLHRDSSDEENEEYCDACDEREKKIKSISDQLVLYSIIRKSLNMSTGKIASQCQHAMHYLANKYYGHCEGGGCAHFCERFGFWEESDFHTKITLEASDKEFNILKEEYDTIIVIDAGKTEIAAGSETVMILYPMLREERSKTLKRLQSLK